MTAISPISIATKKKTTLATLSRVDKFWTIKYKVKLQLLGCIIEGNRGTFFLFSFLFDENANEESSSQPGREGQHSRKDKMRRQK